MYASLSQLPDRSSTHDFAFAADLMHHIAIHPDYWQYFLQGRQYVSFWSCSCLLGVHGIVLLLQGARCTGN
jgi:hypothetical protein